jgi:hypothetical protein
LYCVVSYKWVDNFRCSVRPCTSWWYNSIDRWRFQWVDRYTWFKTHQSTSKVKLDLRLYLTALAVCCNLPQLDHVIWNF